MKTKKGLRTRIFPGHGKTETPEKSSSRESSVKELIRMVSSTEKHVHCVFFKVPEPIRRVRSGCYKPQLLSLGLYGRSTCTDGQCSMMENVKLEVASAVLKVLLKSTERAKTEVDSRVPGIPEEKKVLAVWDHLCDQLVPPGDEGDEIWKQYSDAPQDLTFPVLQHQLVLDAMFLVSFMLFQHANPQTRSLGIAGFGKYETLFQIFTRAGILCNINTLNSDIWLFENQIPLLLIRRMVSEMYLHEGDTKSRSGEQKKAAAEQAFDILIRKTFQKALRVLPGNYRTRSGLKTEMCVTDRMLESTILSLKKRSHLLECLHRLVCSWDEKPDETEEGSNLNHVDSLDKARLLTEEEGVSKNYRRWGRMMRSPVTNLMKSRKGKSMEDAMPEENRHSKSGTLELRTKSNRGNRKDSWPQHNQKRSISESSESDISMSSGSIMIEVVVPSAQDVTEESKPKSQELRWIITGEKHQNELGSHNDPASVQHPVVLQSPPALQEFEGESPTFRLGSPARYQKSRLGEEQRADSSASQMEQARQRMRKRRASPRQLQSVPKIEPRPSFNMELGSPYDPASVRHLVVLQSPPVLQEFESESPTVRLCSPARYEKSRLGEEQRADSSASQMEQARQRMRKRRASRRQLQSVPKMEPRASFKQPSTSVSAQGSPTDEASHSEPEEQPLLRCLPNRFVRSICAGETAIQIDSYILPTVTVLREVGIRVKGDTSPGCHCKVELKDSFLPWGNATLNISPLHVDGTAEILLRNLVAFEIVSSSEHKLITYLQCLDDLIDTDSDVSMLKEGLHPVILNSSLDGKHVATLFNNLLDGCRVYYNPELEAIREKVRSYYLQRWRRSWTEFKERYCNGRKPWLAISLFAGYTMLSFGAIQTVYTILDFYKS